jgi:O-antigen/teichoic acid export membrane protein
MLSVDAGVRTGSAKKGVVKNVVSLQLVQIANYVFPFITIPIISRVVGPDKLGVINFSAAFMTYFTLLINFGFDLSATRAIAASKDSLETRNRVFNQVVLAKVVLFIASLVLFLVALFTIPELRDEKAVAVFSFVLCFSWVITPNWLYQAMQELSRVAIFNMATKVLVTLVILWVIREKSDYVWAPLVTSVAQVIVGVYSFYYAIKRYKIRLQLPPLKPVLQLLWNERIIFFSQVVINLYTTTNVVLLGFLQSSEQVGFYTAGYRLILILQQFLMMPISQALFPLIGAAFAQGRERGLDVVRQVIPVINLLTIGASIVLFLLGPLMILFLYGDRFEPSIAVFRILAILPVIIGFSNMFGIQTMLNLKMDKTFFRITAIGALTSIALNFLLVTRFGFIGSAITWLVTELFITTAMFVVLSKNGVNLIERRYFTAGHLMTYLKPIIVTLKQKINR